MAASNYQLKGNPIGGVIGHLLWDEVGREVIAVHNERFKGKREIEEIHRYRKDQPILFSNVPKVLSYDQILRERFPGHMLHVLSPEEVVQYWDGILERDSTTAITNSVVIYPDQGKDENLKRKVLRILKIDGITVPLVVSGLGVEMDYNEQGFTFIETDHVHVRATLYFSQEGRVRYEKGGLVQSERGVPIFVHEKSGLHGLYRHGSNGIYVGAFNLLASYDFSPVQLLQESRSCAADLEERI